MSTYITINDLWDLAVEYGAEPERVELSRSRGGVQVAIRSKRKGLHVGHGVTDLEAAGECLSAAALANQKWDDK